MSVSTGERERDRFGFVIEEVDKEDDYNTQRLEEVQRRAWTDFLASRDDKLDETWLWQYWRDESRYKSQVNKRFMAMFSSKLGAQKQVKELIRRGVPDELRSQVWWACSGGQQKMEAAPKEMQYGALVQRIHEVQDSVISVDIEKDLHRTFPSSALLSTPSKTAALRKVLYAYALRNPELGYCQSMNFVGAVLLVYLSEEQAFWVLCSVIEDIAPPDYYSKSMIGSRIDQMVFESCLAWKLPKLHAHFKSMNMMLEPVTCPWILCLYGTALPMAHVCRVWDCLLWEGNVVLLRVGLSMLQLKQPQLLAAGDFVEVYSLLRSSRSTAYDIAAVEGIREPAVLTAHCKAQVAAGATTPSPPSSGSAKEKSDSVFGMFSRPAPVLSRLDTLMFVAFDKSWIKSIPRESIARLRAKFKLLLEAQSGANRERANTMCVAKGLACDDGSGQGGGSRPTIHSLLVNRYNFLVTCPSVVDCCSSHPFVWRMYYAVFRAMEDMMAQEHAGLHEIATLYADVNAGSGMIWEIESSVREVWAEGDRADGSSGTADGSDVES